MQQQLTPDFGEYELIDSGNFEKLERFGRYITRRPEPQAIWRPTLAEEEWRRLADAWFLRDKVSDERGEWRMRGGMPARWTVDYAYKAMRLRMRLALTSFKHVGIFPEQAANWDFIYDSCLSLGAGPVRQGASGSRADGLRRGAAAESAGGSFRAENPDGAAIASAGGMPGGAECRNKPAADHTGTNGRRTPAGSDSLAGGVADRGSGRDRGTDSQHDPGGGRRSQAPRVLNLFAYTGGATLAARAAGAEVTHVDSVKPVVTWARENVEQSGLEGVRWIVEDALRFVQREVRRGNRYDGIILDPPAYGRGANGERWILEDNIGEMLDCCARLLEPQGAFLVLNLYSMGLSSTLARTAVRQVFGAPAEEQWGELCFTDRGGKELPLGTYYRQRR